MDDLALEVLQTFDVGITWLVQLTNSRDKKVTLDRVARAELGVFASRDLDVDFPTRLGIVPRRSFDGRVETDVLVELVLIRYIAQIFLIDISQRSKPRIGSLTRISSWPGYSRVQSGFCSNEYEYSMLHTSQQQPGYLLSCHVPPMLVDFSTMMKLWHLLRLIRSMAIHMPVFRQFARKITMLIPVLTRYACANDYDRSTCMVFVPDGNFRPWFCAAHLDRNFLLRWRSNTRETS